MERQGRPPPQSGLVEYLLLMKVAIVGIACRFPGGIDSAESFWRVLNSRTVAIAEAPPRWDWGSWYHPDSSLPAKTHSRWGGFLDDIEGFDAEFFGISPREATRMDPQQRLLLELAWEAIEDAGISPKSVAGSNTGVFVGISNPDYLAVQNADPGTLSAYTHSGSAFAIAANRISYVFDLRGPSLALDTACASSLTAIHQACESIRAGHSRVALAGGVNSLLTPLPWVGLSKASFLSWDPLESTCRHASLSIL